MCSSSNNHLLTQTMRSNTGPVGTIGINALLVDTLAGCVTRVWTYGMNPGQAGSKFSATIKLLCRVCYINTTNFFHFVPLVLEMLRVICVIDR